MRVEILVVDDDTGEALPCRLAFRGEEVDGIDEVECDGRWEGELPDVDMEVEISRADGWEVRTMSLPAFIETYCEIRLCRSDDG